MRLHSNRHLPNLLLLALFVLCGPPVSEGNEDDLRKACSTIFHEPEINGAALRFNFSFGGNLRPRRQFVPGSDDGAGQWPQGVPPALFPAPPPGGAGLPATPGGAGAPPPFSCFLVFAVGPAKERVRGSRILVQVSDLRLPPGSKCTGAGDAVRVYSVLRGRLFLVREFCENDNYYPAIITESHMAVVTITFPEAPSDRRARGFNLKVEAYTDIFEELARRNLSDKLTGPPSNQSEMYGTMKRPEDKEHEWNVLSQQSWGHQGFHPYLPSRHPLSEPNFGFHGHGSTHAGNTYPSTNHHQSFHGQHNSIDNGAYQPPQSSGHFGFGHLNNHIYPINRPPKIKEDPGWNTFEEHHSTHGHVPTNTWSPVREQGVHSGNVQLPTGTWYPESDHSAHISHSGISPPISWSPIQEHENWNNNRPTEVQHGTLENTWNGRPSKKPAWQYAPASGNINDNPQKYSEWSTFNTHVPGRPSNNYLLPHISHLSSSHGHWNSPRPQKITLNQPTSSWIPVPSNENHDFSQIEQWNKPETNKNHQWSAVNEPIHGRPTDRIPPPDTWAPIFHHDNPISSHHQENKAPSTGQNSWSTNSPQLNREPWIPVPSNENHEFSQIEQWNEPETNKNQQWSAVNEPNHGRPTDHIPPPDTWAPIFHHDNAIISHHQENKAPSSVQNSWSTNSPQLNREPWTTWSNTQDWSSAESENEKYWSGFK